MAGFRTTLQSLHLAYLHMHQSQMFAAMQDCKDLPAVKALLSSANRILGYDLLALCLEGPKEKLDDTAYSQPALYLAGLAAVEKLRTQDASAVEGCSVTAGLSLGEYCALVFAGAMSFEDGLKVTFLAAADPPA